MRMQFAGTCLLCSFLTLLATVLMTHPAAATSGGGIHIPTVTNFCGVSTVMIEATICNETSSGQLYWMEFQDGGPIDNCLESIIPSHSFQVANPVYVPAGGCVAVPIEIQRPSQLNSLANVCYWITFLAAEEGGIVWLGASLIDLPPICVDMYFEEYAIFIHPLVPVAIDPLIINYGTEPYEFLYLLEVRNQFGERDDQVMSLNGADPGEWIFGSIEIREGESARIPLSIEWLDPGDSGSYYDIVLLSEQTFEDIASLGVHLFVEAPSDAPELPAVSLESIQVSPNPSSGDSSVRFELPAELSESLLPIQAFIFDAGGRQVRGPLEIQPLAWDGRDDTGRPVGPGTFWVKISSQDQQWVQKLTRIR